MVTTTFEIVLHCKFSQVQQQESDLMVDNKWNCTICIEGIVLAGLVISALQYQTSH